MPYFAPPAALDLTAGDIVGIGPIAAAGAVGLAADSGHVHPPIISFKSGAQGILQLVSSVGVNGTRAAFQADASNPAGSAELMLAPGPNAPQGALNAELLLMNQVGVNYERFTIAAVSSQYQIDSTYNGVGVARSIVIQAGGSVSNAIDSQPGVTVYGDGSVDLEGASYAFQGKNWGVTRTRIADHKNTGNTRLLFDTRTAGAADNAADSTFMEFRRGGAGKWDVGLNPSGRNADTFDFFRIGIGEVMILFGNGDARLAGKLTAIGGVGLNTVDHTHQHQHTHGTTSNGADLTGPGGADNHTHTYTSLFSVDGTGAPTTGGQSQSHDHKG